MRKFLSVFLLVIFILTFPLALLYYNSNRTILSPKYYKNAFAKIDFYNRLITIDPRVITNYLGEQEGTGEKEIDQSVEAKEYYSRIMSMVSPEVLKMTVDNNVDQIFEVLDNGSEAMTIDLSLLKNSFNINNLSGTDTEFISQIKDSYVIPIPQELKGMQTTIAKRNTMAPIYLGITLLLLLLSAALWPNWKGKLRAPGIVLLVMGIIIIPSSFLLKLLPMPGLGLISIKELSGIIGDLYNNMKSEFYSLYLIEGIAIFGLGLILTIVSAFLPGNPQVAQQVAIPASPPQNTPTPVNPSPVPQAPPAAPAATNPPVATTEPAKKEEPKPMTSVAKKPVSKK